MKIVVNTCDANYWAVPLFVEWFSKSWAGCPHRLEILAETNPIVGPWLDDQPIDVIRIGKAPTWSDLMIRYVSQVNDDPFMLILEDYIVYRVDISLVGAAIDLIEGDDDIGMVRLVPVPGPTLEWSDDRFGLFDMHEPYSLSLQAALWKPQVLRDLLVPGENPWQFETLGSRERASTYNKFMFVGTLGYSMHYLNYIGRGKPRRIAVNALDRIARGEFIPMAEVDYANPKSS